MIVMVAVEEADGYRLEAVVAEQDFGNAASCFVVAAALDVLHTLQEAQLDSQWVVHTEVGVSMREANTEEAVVDRALNIEAEEEVEVGPVLQPKRRKRWMDSQYYTDSSITFHPEMKLL